MQSAAPDELIASVLDGIQLEISRWTSGVCRFDGTLSGHFENAPEQDLEGPLPGYLAFDHARMRYEIDRPGWVADPKSIRPVAEASDDGRVMAETMRGRLGKKYADDGVHWTVWQSDQPLAVIGNPDDFPNRLPNEFGDIRGITLFEPLAIEQSFSLNRMLGKRQLRS